jgi:hypothetical protein
LKSLLKERVVTTEDQTEVAKSHEMQYFETSAKNGTYVSEAVELCVAEIEKNSDEGAYEVDLGKSVTEMEFEGKGDWNCAF